MRVPISCAVLCLAVFGAASCGGSTDTPQTILPPADSGVDDSAPADDGATDGGSVLDAKPDAKPIDTNYPAPHPPMPQVVTGGGSVMNAPKIVPIFFPSDPFQTQLETFVATIGATAYWTANVAEYGVGAATSGTSVTLTETAPASIDDPTIQAWLANKIATDAAFPKPTPDTLYAIYYPAGTSISFGGGGGGGTSCVQFGGYHSDAPVTGTAVANVSYAVIPRCATFGPQLSGIDVITATSSHEFIEAATDPLPQSNPAYGQVDLDHIVWEFAIGGGETADMCAQNAGAFGKQPGFNYTVQRSWSNKAALGSHDPCVPGVPSASYFNSAPVLPDTVTLNVGGGIQTKAVKIAVGQSKTIDLDLYSDGPTNGPWDVKVIDASQLQGGTALLSTSLDQSSGQNGDTLHLTIKVLAANQYNAEPFLILSRQGQRQSLWVGLVAQ